MAVLASQVHKRCQPSCQHAVQQFPFRHSLRSGSCKRADGQGHVTERLYPILHIPLACLGGIFGVELLSAERSAWNSLHFLIPIDALDACTVRPVLPPSLADGPKLCCC